MESELELILNTTKCSIEDAVNYLSARTMFYQAVFFDQEKIKPYFREYIQASDKIHNAKVIKINQYGIYINDHQIQPKEV
jgi:hypothetical protein